MEYDILGGIIDPKAVREIEDFEKKCIDSAARINDAFKGLAENGGGTTANPAQLEAITEATKKLTKAQQDLAAAQQKVTEKNTQQKVDAQLKAQQDRQAAVAVSEQATALQRLRAEMDLLVNVQQKLVTAGETTSKQYIENSKTIGRLSTEYASLEQASGKLQVKQSSTYYSTLQLTQVMRELPNFAISARIGFMSLSNNLPMLVEGFQRLSKQIDETTGKQYGWKGAMKEFGASLLGINTIMIIASTLLVMYGDDLVKWVGKMFKGAEATDKLTMSQKALYTVLTGTAGAAQSTMESIMKLGLEITKFGGNSKDAKIIIDEFNKTFNTHLKTIEDVKAAYPGMAKVFIESAIAMQASIAEIDLAATQERRKSSLQLLISGYNKDDVTKTRESIDAMLEVWGKYKLNREALFGEILKSDKNFNTFEQRNENIDILVKTGRVTQDDLKRFSEAQNVISMNLRQGKKDLTANVAGIRDAEIKFTEHSNTALKLLPSPDTTKRTTKADGTVQTAQSIFITTEFYDKKRAELVQLMSDMELRTQKATTDGVIISYNEREKAAQWYFDMLKALAESDNRTANNNAINRFEKDTKDIERKYKHNQELFKAGKISQEELDKSESEFNKAQLAIKNNFDTDFIQAEDKFNKTLQDGAVKLSKTLFDISQDRYKEEIEQLKISHDEKMRLIDENYTKQKAQTESKTPGEILLTAITGYTKDNTQKALSDQKEYEDAKINQEIQSLQDEYNIAETSGARKLEITYKWDDLAKQRKDLYRKYDLTATEETEKRKESIQAETAKRTVEALTTLWDNFFKMYADSLDKQLTKDKKITDERLQDVTDKENAGVLTAQQATEEKARINAYAQSQQDEIDRKKAEAEKTKFFGQQAMALAQVWINFAEATASFENMLAAGAFTPLYTGIALASTALIAAQTIPAFAAGGTMDKEGFAVLGDGGKNELFMSPTGKWGISPAIPTLFNLEKGTKILPDVNKIDLTGMLALANARPYDNGSDKLEKQLIGLRMDLSKQRPAQLKGMRLIRQLQQSEYISRRNKSLMQ